MRLNLSLFNQFIDLIIPLRCIKCGTIVENKEGLCATCWPLIPFITKPYCACCGLPFEFEIEDAALCGSCSRSHPSFISARSVFCYTSESKDLILKFKHTDSISPAPLYAQWMTACVPDIIDPLLIPVPLHWTRLFSRTYNQAALLAREIANIKGWSYAPTLLIRKRRTPSQGHFSKEKRENNVKGAFAVSVKTKHLLNNRTVLLVDDVYTTGSTLNACTKTLLKAGAKEVHTVTLGRVV